MKFKVYAHILIKIFSGGFICSVLYPGIIQAQFTFLSVLHDKNIFIGLIFFVIIILSNNWKRYQGAGISLNNLTIPCHTLIFTNGTEDS